MNEFQFRTDLTGLSSSDCESLSQAELLALADTECRELWESVRLCYASSEGERRLAIELTSRLYPGRSPGDVAVMGPQEALFATCTVLCDLLREDHPGVPPEAIVTWPAYQGLHETLGTCGARVSHWEGELTSDGNWRFCLDQLRRLLDEKTTARILVVNFPHNPTGYCPSPEDWHALITLCQERKLILLSDEIYSGIGARLEPACQLYERAVTFGALSKLHGLPGLRVGWLVSRDARLLARVRNLRNYLSVCLPPPIEVLALIALRNLPGLIVRSAGIVADNLEKAAVFFQEFSHLFHYEAPQGGALSLVEMRRPLLERFSTGREFCDHLMRECGVFLVSGRELLHSDVWLRFGHGRKNFGDGLVRLAEHLRRLGL